MNLKIKLKNPRHCEGCPCLNYDFGHGITGCNLGYWESDEPMSGEGKPYDAQHRLIRPKKCIEENGK